MHLRLLSTFLAIVSSLSATEQTDVFVFGATPCGIAAAIGAAREGKSVILAEPTKHIGGMVTSGLSHTDFRTFESITGFYLTFTLAVEGYYRQKYGPSSAQLKDCWRGLQAEPHVNELILERLIAAHPSIRVWRECQLREVEKAGARIAFVRCSRGDSKLEAEPKIAIDASYEGDLIALAGVPFHVGREGRQQYGESLAPEQADNQLQAYNFRFIATDDPANRVPIEKPQDYDRAQFTDVLPLLKPGKIDKVFGYPSKCIIKAQLPPLPNRKYDLNDVSGGIIRMSMPGQNLAWPEGNAKTRADIFQTHLRYNVGLLYFMQNDSAVPEAMRTAAREFGWCKDEFTDNAHLPWQLYVREARRMMGQRIFTERDSEPAKGDARAVLRTDSIAIGDYGNNCHGTSHEGLLYGGKHTGEFYKHVAPYQIPYGTLIPRDIENLLSPGAPSATHVGFCALRLEPIWAAMGEAAGIAAAMAIQQGTSVQKVNVEQLQILLHKHGSATTYVSDIPPNHPLFIKVQQLAVQGGLHGLHSQPKNPGERGKNIEGQYFEAFPYHAFQPDLPLTEDLFKRWLSLAPDLIAEQFHPNMKRRDAFR
jgi:hypothetical protein